MPQLPDDLKIASTFVGSKTDYDGNWLPAIITVARYPTIESADGFRPVYSFEAILKSLHKKHTFVIVEPGKFDSILRWFSDSQLFGLELGAPITYKGWEITYRGSSLKLSRGKENKYLWNLWKFFILPREPISLDEVDSLVLLLMHHLDSNGISYSHLSSPSAVSRQLMLDYAWREFLNRDLIYPIVQDAYAACHGGRSESVGIGTIKAWNYDMKQAHLKLLSDLPSIVNTQYREDWAFIPEASYGLYLIRVRVPTMNLCPLPVELSDDFTVKVAWPSGEVVGWYAKPFLDLLTEMGIKFEVLKSHQYIPVDTITYPFAKMVNKVRAFTRNVPPFINAKGFYYGMVGSTISIRWKIDDFETGELVPHTYNVFNPMLYAHVLAAQTCKVFVESNKKTPIAIRSDAITIDGKISSSLKFEDSGEMLFVNPLFKAFPSGKGDEWRDIVRIWKDKKYLEYYPEEYPVLAQKVKFGYKLGKPIQKTIRVFPNHGNRLGTTPSKLGDLLDGWYPSRPMTM